QPRPRGTDQRVAEGVQQLRQAPEVARLLAELGQALVLLRGVGDAELRLLDALGGSGHGRSRPRHLVARLLGGDRRRLEGLLGVLELLALEPEHPDLLTERLETAGDVAAAAPLGLEVALGGGL